MICFDSHAHLDDTRFDADRDEIFATLAENSVGYVMNVGCDLPSSERSIALARKYDFVYAAVGSHPDDAAQVDALRVERYRTLAQEEKVRAIGEIGLDYYYDDVPREVQRKAFAMQLELARQVQLPVIIHERDAHADALAMLADFPEVRGVFHCYSGSPEMAMELVKKGWYIGFTGVLTFKNARKAVETAKMIPLDRILVETDCPYMAPEPFRGRRNDSRYVPYMAKKLAELRGISEEEAAAATTQNAKRLFAIE